VKLDGMVQVRKDAKKTEYERHPERATRIMQQGLTFRMLSGRFMRDGVVARQTRRKL